MAFGDRKRGNEGRNYKAENQVLINKVKINQ